MVHFRPLLLLHASSTCGTLSNITWDGFAGATGCKLETIIACGAPAIRITCFTCLEISNLADTALAGQIFLQGVATIAGSALEVASTLALILARLARRPIASRTSKRPAISGFCKLVSCLARGTLVILYTLLNRFAGFACGVQPRGA